MTERGQRDCECGHQDEAHRHFSSARNCGICPCRAYHRTFFHWFIDAVSQ